MFSKPNSLSGPRNSNLGQSLSKDAAFASLVTAKELANLKQNGQAEIHTGKVSQGSLITTVDAVGDLIADWTTCKDLG
ncbi:hypothetical protein AM10699_01270 [Acaryochloris marina MBIC10699]|nr:hypothetical protein AM10699_01270 [Acaryochloris marina MBIC10699]